MDEKNKAHENKEDKSTEASRKLDEALKNLEAFNKKTKELSEKSQPPPKPAK